MTDNRPVVVLLGGAWGHQTRELLAWWFQHLISYFESQKWRVVPLPYEGTTLHECATSVLRGVDQLDSSGGSIPGGSMAICYSMGAQVCREVLARQPRLFYKVILIGGLERQGVRHNAFLRGTKIALWPFARGLRTGNVMFSNWEQVWQIMYNAKPGTESDAQMMLAHMAPEPTRVILELSMPGMRRLMPEFPCPVLALQPAEDFFVRHATYQDEKRVSTMPVMRQGHAFIRSPLVVEYFNNGQGCAFNWLRES